MKASSASNRRTMNLTAYVTSCCALLSPSFAFAAEYGEPVNNNSFLNGDNNEMSMYQGLKGSTTTWTTAEKIAVAGDIDYHIIGCGGRTSVRSVGIWSDAAFGDLDIYAYRMDGTFLGSSALTTNTETINVLASAQTVVLMKVLGFAGAVNSKSYKVKVDCT